MDANKKCISKDETACEVKHCRQEYEIIILGVKLCGRCYEKHCDGKVMETKKGVLDFCSGCVVLRKS